MSEIISGADFNALFRKYRHTAWRLETRTHYGKLNEDRPFSNGLPVKTLGWAGSGPG